MQSFNSQHAPQNLNQFGGRFPTGFSTPLNATGSPKPFSGFQAAPVISPYQAMYTNVNNGTLDPYNAFVRPILDQQRMDQQRLDQERSNSPSSSFSGGTMGGMQNVPGSSGLTSPQNFQYYRQFTPGPSYVPATQPGMGP
jgi:hypothetical protein